MTNEQKYLIYLDYLGVKENYLHYKEKSHWTIFTCHNFGHFINIFSWEDTKEGYDFWANLYLTSEIKIDNYLRTKKLNRVL
jgi:hypothetical protein